MRGVDPVQQLAALLGAVQRVAVITGAGMSTESGIPDFRSPTGIYAQGVSEDVFDIRTFENNPTRFYRNIRPLIAGAWEAAPNPGHCALTALATDCGKDVSVVTQNIDTLHQQAGNPVVYPVHGTVETFTCEQCHGRVDGAGVWQRVVHGEDLPRHGDGGCNGILKPDIVFFGERLPEQVLSNAQAAVRRADLVVVAGSSMSVQPAAMLPAYRGAQCRLAVVNQAPTGVDAEADVVIRAKAGETLAAAVNAVR